MIDCICRYIEYFTHQHFGEAPFEFHSVGHWLPWRATDAATPCVWSTQTSHAKARLIGLKRRAALDTTNEYFTHTAIAFAGTTLHDPHCFNRGKYILRCICTRKSWRTATMVACTVTPRETSTMMITTIHRHWNINHFSIYDKRRYVNDSNRSAPGRATGIKPSIADINSHERARTKARPTLLYLY